MAFGRVITRSVRDSVAAGILMAFSAGAPMAQGGVEVMHFWTSGGEAQRSTLYRDMSILIHVE